MLNKIIEFSVRNKLIIGLFVLALLAFGSYQTTLLPIDAVPDITNNQVQVITVAPSFGATDIERLVTFPIEQANSNINGIKEIRSFSRFGLSLVTIVFHDQTDIYWARQQVAERLQKLQTVIPSSIGIPEMGPISTGLGEIYQYVVKPKSGFENKYTETELRTIQDWMVRRQLLGVEGVAEVSSFGSKLKQYEIAINPNELQSYGLTINDVFEALEKNNQNTGGAYIEKGPTALFIRSEGLIGNQADIENIAIKSTENGTPIFISNVAEVIVGHATRFGALCYNDEGEVAGGIVLMLKGANSSIVINKVKERIALIQKTLPEGVEIEPFLDRTKMVNNAISTVEKNLMEGALIVVFILVLFLGNFRAGLLVASVIPLAMLFAIILMNFFGVSGNLMSLGALDFGLIVDGAVIIVEAVMHQLAVRKREAENNQQALDGLVENASKRMMNSAVFGQIIILIVYLPIFTLQGIEGKMFKPMAQTVAFALLGAFVLSLTYIPMMSALILGNSVSHKKNISDKIMDTVTKVYQKYLIKVMRKPKTVIATVVVMFGFAVFLLLNLGGEFIPALEEGDFAVETRVLNGSSLTTTIESTQKASHLLLMKFPEVEKVVTKIGSGEIPSDPMPMDAADLMIILKDKSEWTSAHTFNDLAEKMGKALEDIPGVTFSFQYPVQMRFNELMTGAKQDVVIKIFGENLDTLASYAKKVGEIVGKVQGCQDLFVEPVTGMPQIVIDYNRDAIAQYHLHISDINQIINTAFAGQSSGLVFEGEKRFDLVVRLKTEHRDHLEDVQNLLIPTPQGTQIPLYLLAKVAIKNGPSQIQREDAKRRIIVGFNAKGRDVQSIVEELQTKVNTELKLPAGYFVTYGGAFENLNAAKQRLLIAVPVSLIMIFILLYFAFNSVKQGLLIYTAIPLSAIGGIYFLTLREMPFSISAGVGFIALFGVAVLNGIVLIAEFNRLKKEGLTNLSRIVVKGTAVRLRPVLMTAFVASLGFLPMALSNGAGAEVQRPLATVVIGGLLIATFLTLFLLPILYVQFEKSERPKISNTSNLSRIALILIFASFGIFTASAQQTISLNAAIDTALKNNFSVKNKKLQASYQEKLIQAAANIPQANLSFEAGQINSSYVDNRIAISQSFNFPSVYVNQKSILASEWKLAVLELAMKEAEVKKSVTQLFCSLEVLRKRERLLLTSDTLYAEFLKKANVRFEKGESNILEKATAETQLGNIQLQLSTIIQEIELAKLQFQLLLNTELYYEPKEVSYRLAAPILPDSLSVPMHPSIKRLEQQKVIADASIKLEKSKLLPDLNFAYSNMSMRGTGSDNITYGINNRFNSGQVGLGIPLFYGSQKAKINATKAYKLLTENNYTEQVKLLSSDYQYAVMQYKKSLKTLNYCEQTSLSNAKLITKTATIQFTNGEINYLEWVMLCNQAITLESNYLDALSLYNESVAKLQYITNY